MRADSEDLLAARPVARDERPDRVLGDLEAERLEFLSEVAERVPVDVGVGVPADRLRRERVVRAGKPLDVALDAVGARGTLDRRHGRGP